MIKKIRAKIKKLCSFFIKKKITTSCLLDCKLVMTLLVKNEVDVIRYNIEFHLRQGVDYIIATDNLSDDGTYEILQEYEKKGVLHLISEKDQNHNQALWVNTMGNIARDRYEADIVFHCDGDEFWFSKSGSLKKELLSRPLVDILNISVKNVLLMDKGGSEKFPIDAVYVVENSIASSNVIKDSQEKSFFLFKYPSKVFYRVENSYLDVSEGNHRVINRKQFVSKNSNDIIIYHFPIRGVAQFFSKVINGGAALERNSRLDKKVGWHWRRWYEYYKNDKLDEEYRRLNLSEGRVEKWIDSGVVVEDITLISKLGI